MELLAKRDFVSLESRNAIELSESISCIKELTP